MKLKYELEKETDLKREVVAKRIVHVLGSKEYRILYQFNNTIEFDSHTSGFRGNWEPSQLSEGNFKLESATSDILKVKLTYYISFVVQIVMLVVVLTIAIVSDDCGVLFLGGVIIFFSIIEYINLRMKAKALINDALNYSA